MEKQIEFFGGPCDGLLKEVPLTVQVIFLKIETSIFTYIYRRLGNERFIFHESRKIIKDTGKVS